jgi:membrane fusion protein (multidrug efflux system)
MKKILILLLILFSSVTIYSCGGDTESKTESEKNLQAVKTSGLTAQTFNESYKFVGVVKPYQTAKIASEEGGLITYLSKDKGSFVRRGEVIVRLKKDVDYASYDQSMAQMELAKSNFERIERLYKEGVVTEQEFVNSKYQLEIAEKTLNVYETRLSKGYVVSPISGVVDDKYMSRGEVTMPGSPILNIVDVSRVKISAGIPERYIGEVSKGSKVNITFDVYPGETFTGTVSYVSPTINTINRTFEIEIILNNSGGKLKPEMSAMVEITSLSIDNAIVLRQDQIVDFGDEKYVFILEGDKAVKRKITLGGRNGNFVHIESGLNPGDVLITEGFQSLVDGDKVEVIN